MSKTKISHSVINNNNNKIKTQIMAFKHKSQLPSKVYFDVHLSLYILKKKM